MMGWARKFLGFAFLLITVGCMESSGDQMMAPMAESAPARVARVAPQGQAMAQGDAGAVALPQKLIRTGSMELKVEEIDGAVKAVGELTSKQEGYVADTEVRRHEGGSAWARLRLRVPSANFEATLIALRSLGDVELEKSTVEDVTKAYADLEIRLRLKKETESRLRSLLQDRTASLGDVIEVERELSRVITEIEQLEGERRYFDQRIDTSTIEVSLSREGSAQGSAFEPIWEAFDDAGRTLSYSIRGLILFSVSLLPWVVVGVPLFLLLRWAWRRRRKS